jgi:hypothetical protein
MTKYFKKFTIKNSKINKQMNTATITTGNLSSSIEQSLNTLYRGYNLSEISENADKLENATLFDDYLALMDILKQMRLQVE